MFQIKKKDKSCHWVPVPFQKVHCCTFSVLNVDGMNLFLLKSLDSINASFFFFFLGEVISHAHFEVKNSLNLILTGVSH